MQISVEKCLEKITNRFALAAVTSKRWEQVIQGSRPMVEYHNLKSMEMVLKEIETGKLALNVEERMIEKLGTPIPLPQPPVVEEPPAPPHPAGPEGEAA